METSGGETAAQMWPTYGCINDLVLQRKWSTFKSIHLLSIFPLVWYTLSIIKGFLFICAGEIFIFDMDLVEINKIPANEMKKVYQVSHLADDDLMAATASGLYHISYTGTQFVECYICIE